jgi:hypothetical protein
MDKAKEERGEGWKYEREKILVEIQRASPLVMTITNHKYSLGQRHGSTTC